VKQAVVLDPAGNDAALREPFAEALRLGSSIGVEVALRRTILELEAGRVSGTGGRLRVPQQHGNAAGTERSHELRFVSARERRREGDARVPGKKEKEPAATQSALHASIITQTYPWAGR
jgi:hypothetical protein